MPNIEKALITNVDLSNYVRVIPDEPINANWPVATCPVLHLSAVLSPSAAQPVTTEFRNVRRVDGLVWKGADEIREIEVTDK